MNAIAKAVADATTTVSDNAPEGSELAIAQLFASRWSDEFRWSPGLGWMRRESTHWERDVCKTRFKQAKRICREVADTLDKESLQRNIASARTAGNALSLAESDERIATPVDRWDDDPMMLNTRGGVYDLRTGEKVGEDGLFRHVTRVAPATTDTPLWLRFLEQVFDGDQDAIQFMQRLAGYCLTGDIREQKLFFFYGEGANGKNVLIDTLTRTSGSYSHALPTEALMSRRNQVHPTELASLMGARLAVSSEIEANAYWAESRIKQLTGDEELTARFMRQDFFTFPITHKHIVVGNHRPRLQGDDYAMARRMVLVPFEQCFEGANRDDHLKDKLAAEHPGILAWAIEGARQWNQNGLCIPQRIADASHAYMAENDDIKLWVADACHTGPGMKGRSRDLYASFRQWKDAQGEHAPSGKAFAQRLARSYDKGRDNQGVYFVGIDCNGANAQEYARAKGW